MNQAPRLQFDVLLNVAEKLIFSPDNDFRLDLRDPTCCDIVNFMFAGPACRWALFVQFRKLTKLSVNPVELQLYAPKPIQGVRGTLSNNKEFFQGPFVVSDQFFRVLFCQGVLQPTIIDTFFIFGSRNDKATTAGGSSSEVGGADNCKIVVDGHQQVELDCSEVPVVGETPAESMFLLFLNRDRNQDYTTKFTESELAVNLETLKFHDDTTIYKHISRILNLNAESVHLEVSTELKNIISAVQFSNTVNADRTSSFTLSCTIDVVDLPERETRRDFPVDAFFALFRHICRSCPNLCSCVVSFLLQVTGEFSDDDFKCLSEWLLRALLSLSSRSEAMLAETAKECSLTIAFRAFFPENTLMEANKTDHKLARLGEQRCLEEGADASIGIDDLPDTYTIIRKIQLRDNPSARLVCTLIGLEEDSINDNWDGFNGHMLLPVYAQAMNAVAQPSFNQQVPGAIPLSSDEEVEYSEYSDDA